MRKIMNLQLFADENAPAAGAAEVSTPTSTPEATSSDASSGSTAPAAAPEETTAETGTEKPDPAKRRADWEAARDSYRDLYEADQADFVKSRVKAAKSEAAKANEDAQRIRDMLHPLYAYYQIKPGDEDALQKAIDADNMYYEKIAMENDMPPDKYRETMELKRYKEEHEEMERVRRQSEREAAEQREAFDRWAADEEKIRAELDKDFDVVSEIKGNETFKDLVINKKVDVATAYYATHAYELAERKAREARESAVKDIAANGARPTENGVKSGSAAVIKDKPLSQMSKEEREAFVRRNRGFNR